MTADSSPRLGITGGYGFFGWHLRCVVRRMGWPEPVLASRATFADSDLVATFVQNVDAVVHLAGVNRAHSDEAVVEGNRDLASMLAVALRQRGAPLTVVYSNSTKALSGGAYGGAKAAAAETLAAAQSDTGGAFVNVIFPHIYGEFGRPFYNSAISTFAHQFAVGETPTVDVDATLELLHAQEAAALIVDLLASGESATVKPPGSKISVSASRDLLEEQHHRYVGEHTVPNFANVLEQRLFNVLRSQLFANGTQSFPIVRHTDPRGYFSELIRNDGLGQSSISATVPGVTRGDHYHLDKFERFLVLAGEAQIRIRRILTDEVFTFDVSGDEPVAIDMPPLCTHNITNTGDTELLTYFWAADQFDPAVPDTFVEPVEIDATETLDVKS